MRIEFTPSLCFTLVRSKKPIFLRGRRRLAVVNEAKQVCRIGPDCAPHEIAREVMHELWHPYTWHFPPPADPMSEEFARYVANFASLVVTQVASQGGVAAMSAVGMDSSDATFAEKAVTTAGRVHLDREFECPSCHCKVCADDVKIFRAGIDPKLGVPIVKLELECDFCEKTHSWLELATASGLPTRMGVPVLSKAE